MESDSNSCRQLAIHMYLCSIVPVQTLVYADTPTPAASSFHGVNVIKSMYFFCVHLRFPSTCSSTAGVSVMLVFFLSRDSIHGLFRNQKIVSTNTVSSAQTHTRLLSYTSLASSMFFVAIHKQIDPYRLQQMLPNLYRVYFFVLDSQG